MAIFMACLVLFLAMAGHSSGALYCVCNNGVSNDQLQKNIDYACGAGADCSQILQNGACYNPNTVRDHCNYAVNSYFQNKNQAPGSCIFSGTATTAATPPPTATAPCVYPTSPSNTATPATNNPGGTNPSNTPTTLTPATNNPGGTNPSNTPTTLTPGIGTTTGTGPSFGLGPSGTGISNTDGSGAETPLPSLFVSLAASLLLSLA